MKDYLNRPLSERLAMLRKEKLSFCFYTKPDGSRSFIPALRVIAKVDRAFKIGSSTVQWCEDSPARFGAYSDQVLRFLGHTGHYVDTNYDETTRGFVARLPHGKFIACITDPYNWNNETDSGPHIVERAVYDNERDAAIAADDIAERYADDAREAYGKLEAEQSAALAEEDAKAQANRDALREALAD